MSDSARQTPDWLDSFLHVFFFCLIFGIVFGLPLAYMQGGVEFFLKAFRFAVFTVLVIAIRIIPPFVSTWLGAARGSFFDWQFTFVTVWLFMVSFIWLLTGFVNLRLWALFLLLGYAGNLIATVLLAFNRPPKHAQHEFTLAMLEYGLAHNTLARLQDPLSHILHVAYLVAAGVVYFAYELHSDLATRWIFSLTFLWSLLVPLNALLPVYASVPLSRNVQERTRAMLLIERVGALLPNTLMLSVLLWSFGATTERPPLRFGIVTIGLSPVVFATLFTAFALVLIPYLIGFRRAEEWRQELLNKREEILRAVLDVFEFPDPDRRLARLEALVENLETETERFTQADRSLTVIGSARAEGTAAGPEPAAVQVIRRAFEELETVDPRFVHLRFLGELKSQLEDAVRRLKAVDQAEFERLTRDYATFYRDRHARFGDHRVGQGKPWGKMVAGAILLPVIAGVMNELGKGIWKAILEALGQ